MTLILSENTTLTTTAGIVVRTAASSVTMTVMIDSTSDDLLGNLDWQDEMPM